MEPGVSFDIFYVNRLPCTICQTVAIELRLLWKHLERYVCGYMHFLCAVIAHGKMCVLVV